MPIEWKDYYTDKLVEAAKEMAIAARTAPKGKGRDQLHILILTGKEKDDVAQRMREIGEASSISFFRRDAENLLNAPVLLLIGTQTAPREIPYCGFCGLADCDENRAAGDIPCVFASGDLGIALGSAAALASGMHIDNRIMFSAGNAAIEIGVFPSTVKIAHGIPLSASGKNPFFDRK